MKKISVAVFACSLSFCYSQITFTKDLSFGNNGVVEVGTKTNSMSQLSAYNTPTFQDNKLFLNKEIHDSSNNFIGRKFFRLNSNGTPDSTFGNNGEVNVLNSIYFSDSFYCDPFKFYLNSGVKYLSDGQLDAGFGNINSSLTTPYHHYKIVLADGKIISRNQQSISKYNSTGFPDAAFGNNGVQTLLTTLENTSTIFGELFYYDNDFLYEAVNTQGGQTSVRKINFNTGNLDLSFGQNGYAELSNTLSNPVLHCGTAVISQNTASFIHNFKNGTDGQLTKTNSSGIADATFGINGKVNYADSYTFNGDLYSSAENKPLLFENYIFLYSASFDTTNNTALTKIGMRGYTSSGNPVVINGNLHHILQESTVNDTFHPIIKDNFLYVFYDNKISRYIISQSTLSVNANLPIDKSIVFNNPFKNELKLESKEKIESAELYDQSGRLIIQSKAAKSIDTSGLQKGIYIIKITTESSKVISRKAIKI